MSWRSARARVASLTRSRDPHDPDLIDARRELRAARAADYLERVLLGEPALTDVQRAELAELIAPAVPA